MTPSTILTAVRLGQTALDAQHGAVLLLWKRFGLAVRQERQRRNISPARFSRSLNRTSAMLGMMETGKRVWPMPIAEKAVALLKRPEQWPDQGRGK